MSIINKFPTYLTDLSECQLIIAGIPELPSIDFSALSDEDCKKIGWVDVRKIAQKYREEKREQIIIGKDKVQGITACLHAEQGYFDGFKTAQSLNDKKYSEEDMRKALWELGDVLFNNNQHGIKEDEPKKYFDTIIQSLSQPKVFNIEVEMDFGVKDSGVYGSSSSSNISPIKPKITNNSIKITKIL